MTTRTITTQYKAKRTARKGVTLTPCITLAGDWLEAAGFAIGQPVTVQVLNNQLIISI